MLYVSIAGYNFVILSDRLQRFDLPAHESSYSKTSEPRIIPSKYWFFAINAQ